MREIMKQISKLKNLASNKFDMLEDKLAMASDSYLESEKGEKEEEIKDTLYGLID